MADFWEKDLVCRDGVYHVVGDGMHERTDGNIRDNGVPEDPVNTLGYLKTFFTWMPRISEALDLDEKKREKWLEIAENLTPYPKGTIREIQENPTLWKEVDVKLEDLLPEEIKETAILFFFQGLKQKEISDLLHIKLSLVKYRVSKAKELLSKQLEEGRD